MGKVEQSTRLDLKRIIFIGRTYEEYLDMFSLSIEELKGKRILDCPAGACSFTGLGNKAGLDVTACDIAYYYSAEDLERKGLLDIDHAMTKMEKAKNTYVWDYFKDISDLRSQRMSALKECVADMKRSNERYIPVTLPTLPFKDNEFDVILSAHFLFMYDDHLDVQFHIASLDELLRVSKEEIRIFPLVGLGGQRYEHLEQLIRYISDKGCIVEKIRVPYEFQRNANSMLRIRKK